MQGLSSVPLIAVAVGATLLWLIVATARKSMTPVSGTVLLLVWLLGLILWGLASRHFALAGVYHERSFLDLLPGFWLPMVPTLWTITFLFFRAARENFLRIFADHPKAVVALQALRALAVGGVIKGFTGQLPTSFAFPVGIPDMLFGLSALYLLWRWPPNGWSSKLLSIWNAVGIAAILPAAPILMELGLPGPLYTFTSQPDARVLLDYPMALAPTLLVPLFVTLNVLHILTLALIVTKQAKSGMIPTTTSQSFTP